MSFVRSHKMRFWRIFVVFFVWIFVVISLGGAFGDSLGVFEQKDGFAILCLGENGGLNQASVTSYLVKATGTFDSTTELFVGLDMGSTLSGLLEVQSKGSLNGLIDPDDWLSSSYTEIGYVLVKGISSYLVSHPHLDHTIGNYITSTDDVGPKAIFGTSFTITQIATDIFNWKTWPNFGNTGPTPLQTYTLTTVKEDGTTQYSINGTRLKFTAFPLVHGSAPNIGPYPSTAYLLSHQLGTSRLLFFGDTGPDSVQQVDNIKRIWDAVAPYVVDGSLDAILLECSYTDEQPDNQLFGHLTPSHFIAEFDVLTEKVRSLSPRLYIEQMRAIQIIVIHIKPASLITKSLISTKQKIQRQFEELNHLGLSLIFPSQGDRIDTRN
jgi:3',5'-cyclic-nucleotide phosphodiesterase